MSINCCTINVRPMPTNNHSISSTKVAIKIGSQLPSAQESNHGDIFYQYDDGKLYYYDNKREAYDMLTLTDFSINCIEEYAAYDALGRKVAVLKTEEGVARPTFINCRNCGAPVKGHQCEYCWTRYSK